MKKVIFISAVMLSVCTTIHAQDAAQRLQQDVAKLDNATTIKDYQQLANDFGQLAEVQKTEWLPYYYAAYCNAKIGWLNQSDPDNIEGFANTADGQIRKAESLLDTTKQKTALSEIYCVLSMVNRARVFINPVSYGRQYGPAASMYIKMAERVNPANPRALYLEGWEKFSTPKMWGGDKAKAKELLQAAQQKLAAGAATGADPHWGKKETDALLLQLK